MGFMRFPQILTMRANAEPYVTSSHEKYKTFLRRYGLTKINNVIVIFCTIVILKRDEQ